MATVTSRDTEVQKEDQMKINEFSRLSGTFQELGFEIKRKKEELDALEDASYLIEEAFGEDVKFLIGESFFDVSEEFATEYHEKLMEDTKGELEELMDQSDQMEMQMKKLKSHLYAKFGTSINLEDD